MLKRLNKDFAFSETLNAGEFNYYDFKDNKETDDYVPFKNIQIVNQGGADLKVYFNNQEYYKLVPSGTIYERKDQEISYLKIVNCDVTNQTTYFLMLDNDYSQKELLKALVLGREELEK